MPGALSSWSLIAKDDLSQILSAPSEGTYIIAFYTASHGKEEAPLLTGSYSDQGLPHSY